MHVDSDFILEKIKDCGEILKNYYFSNKKIQFEVKEDGSKVTQLDNYISFFFQKELRKKYPEIPFFSEEESKNLHEISNVDKFFLMDPIDGTNGFIKKNDEFTINISFVSNEKPVFSCIFSPIKDMLFYSNENASYKVLDGKNIKIKNKNKNLLDFYKVIATRRKEEVVKINMTLQKYNLQYKLQHISSALKFCIIADGYADIYLRKENIKLWDALAGFHILNNANFFIKDGKGNNILNYILKKKYLKNIQEKEFRINEFIIQNTKYLDLRF